jgi:hypothetical protein
VRLDNQRQGGTLRWKDRRFGRSVGVIWKASASKVVAPPVSIKDWWVGPHKQVLNVLILYQRYGPSKSSSWLSTKVYLFSTASLATMGEKLGIDPRTSQPMYYRLGQEPFFSGAVDLFKSIDDYMKGCYVLTEWDMYGLDPYADWVWGLRVACWSSFSCRVYIDSYRCDSRIWVTTCLQPSAHSELME